MSSGLTVAWAVERAFRRGKIEAFSEAAIAAGGGKGGGEGGVVGLWQSCGGGVGGALGLLSARKVQQP